MSRQEHEIFCKINHYAKNQLYGHIVKLCHVNIKKTDDTVFNFWRAIGLVLSGDLTKARKELRRLRKRKTLRTAFLGALVEVYKLADQEEDEGFNTISNDFEMAKDTASDSSKIHLSLFYLYLGSGFESKALIDEVDEEYEDKYCKSAEVKGWVYLLSDREVVTFECESIFDRHYEGAVLFMLGKAEFYKMKKQYSKSENVLSKIIVGHQNLSFVQVEKAFLYILQNKWLEANEICQILLKKKDPKNFDAMLIHLVYLITHKNKIKVVNSKFKKLMSIVRQNEHKNHKLMYRIAFTFSCIAGQNSMILRECHEILQVAVKLHPLDSDYHTLIGFCYTLQGKYVEAEKDYNTALEYDESSIAANMGLIKSLIFMKKYEQAEELLYTLNDISETLDSDSPSSLGSAAELSFLNYLLIIRNQKDRKKGLSKIHETVRLFVGSIRNLDFTVDYYSKFNPQFVLEVCREILSYCPKEPIDLYSLPSNELKLFDKLLQVLLSTVPGSLEGQYFSAFHLFLTNKSAEALKLADYCTRLDPSFAPSYLLQADLAYRNNQFQSSQSTLNRVLSKNFSVKDRVDYNLLLSKVHLKLGEETKALDVLSTSFGRLKKKKVMNTEEELEFHLQFCRTYVHLGKRKYALKHLRKAKPLTIVAGQGQERIVFSEVELRLHFGEILPALHMLEGIPRSSSKYKLAIRERAKIYLEHLKNPSQYILLFEELVTEEPTKENFLELAGAYMGVHEPEKAIKLYQKALKLDAKNYHIMNLIGEAFVTTHRFHEAIEYYKVALEQNRGEFQLRVDLTHLYITLRMYKEAHELVTETQKVIQGSSKRKNVPKKKRNDDDDDDDDEGEGEGESDDDDDDDEKDMSVSGGGGEKKKKNNPFFLTQLVKTLVMLSKIEEGEKNLESSHRTMEKAISLQDSLLSQLRGQHEEEVRNGRIAMSELHFRLYELEKKGDNRSLIMITHLNNVINFNPKRKDVYSNLCRLHLYRGDVVSSEKMADKGLKFDPRSETLLMCLADVKFKKKQFGEASRIMQKILHRTPHNYHVLEKYILLVRRFGDITQSEEYLELSESDEPGYHYCVGLYLKLLGHYALNEANLSFIKARNSDEWFEKASFHMVEIYLSLELDFLNPWNSINTKINRNNIDSAKSLLSKLSKLPELKHHTREKLVLFESYRLIAEGKNTKDKSSLERALKMLLKERKKEKPNIAIQLGLATGFIVGQMDNKVKRTLKNGLRGVEAYDEYHDELERCRMIIAHFFVKKNEIVQAKKILEQVVKDNKSCISAHDLLGMIMEKESNFSQASTCYETAWFLSNEKSTVIGYKLAFNYLKAKKYANAIQICHKVLAVDPNYPKIKVQILKKAREKLRP